MSYQEEDNRNEGYFRIKKSLVYAFLSIAILSIGIVVGFSFAKISTKTAESTQQDLSETNPVYTTTVAPVVLSTTAEKTTTANTPTSSRSGVQLVLGNGKKSETTAATTSGKSTAIRAYTGMIFSSPGYVANCPITVYADKDSDCFVYFKYIGWTVESGEGRESITDSKNWGVTDLSFYIRAGEFYKTVIPVGEYELYYATGCSDFFGSQLLWADNTEYYKASSTFSFKLSGDYYVGHTITLYKVTNGNLSTREIDEEDFPKGQ